MRVIVLKMILAVEKHLKTLKVFLIGETYLKVTVRGNDVVYEGPLPKHRTMMLPGGGNGPLVMECYLKPGRLLRWLTLKS